MANPGTPNQSLQSGDFKAPTMTESLLTRLLEVNELQLRELRIMNTILALNGAPLGDDLDLLRNDPSINDLYRS